MKNEHEKHIGFAAFVKIGKDFDALSYGREGEPDPEILARRDRVTVFPTSAMCRTAVDLTVTFGDANGYEWCRKAKFQIFEVCFQADLPCMHSGGSL